MAESLSLSPVAILSQASFLAGSVVPDVRVISTNTNYLVEILTDLQKVWFLTNVINMAIILDDYLFIHLLFISIHAVS